MIKHLDSTNKDGKAKILSSFINKYFEKRGENNNE